MRNIGVITKIDKDTATVMVTRTSACGENCASCKAGCKGGDTLIYAVNTADAKVGDRVLTYISDNSALLAAGIAYILPLIFAIAPALVLYIKGFSEAHTLISSIIGLCFGVLFSRLISIRYKSCFMVKIIKVLEQGVSLNDD